MAKQIPSSVVRVKNESQTSVSWYGVRGFHQILPGQIEMLSEEEYRLDRVDQMPGIIREKKGESPVIEETKKEKSSVEEDTTNHTPLLEDLGEVVEPVHEPTIPSAKRGKQQRG